MSKKDDCKNSLMPLLSDRIQLEDFLIKNSNLPGPRANLELLFALSEIYDDFDTLIDWSNISAAHADTDDPKSFLPVCSLVCLGRVFAKNKNERTLQVLKEHANDNRWRIREAVAFGFQIIGETDFNELIRIFDEWFENSNNLEKRAILVSLAHPKFLDKSNAEYCFKITDLILGELKIDDDFKVLKKGLDFTISVFVAANDKLGFDFMEKWIGRDKIIDRIIKENLMKNRVKKIDPEKVEYLLNKINLNSK